MLECRSKGTDSLDLRKSGSLMPLDKVCESATRRVLVGGTDNASPADYTLSLELCFEAPHQSKGPLNNQKGSDPACEHLGALWGLN